MSLNHHGIFTVLKLFTGSFFILTSLKFRVSQQVVEHLCILILASDDDRVYVVVPFLLSFDFGRFLFRLRMPVHVILQLQLQLILRFVKKQRK